MSRSAPSQDHAVRRPWLQTMARLGLALSLMLAWANFLTTGRWAQVESALNGAKQPWYGGALLILTLLAAWRWRQIGRAVSLGARMPAMLLVAGVAVFLTSQFLRFPLSRWSEIPFDDDWTPLFRAAADGVALLERGVVMGWKWEFFGGYPASTDVAQSFALHAFIPMKLFGPLVGFHLLVFVWCATLPWIVWWDLKHEDRTTALVAAGLACFFVSSLSVGLGKSGDVNSLAGLFSASLALLGSRAARLGRRWGGSLIVVGLMLALYSHPAFFVYAGIYLTLEAVYFRDGRALLRLAVACMVAGIAALPVHWESLRYPAFVSTNNVVYNPGSPINWPQALRTLYYNVEILALPHRWFNDYRSLANVWLPAALVMAFWPGRSRVGFYAWTVLLTQAMLRLNLGELGAGFDRLMHMLPVLMAPVFAGFIVTCAGSRAVAAAVAVVMSLFVAVSFTPVPHVTSVREFNPALIDRVASLDGALVLFEVSPHRDMDSDPVGRTPKAPWNVHFEGLLPGVAGQRFYGQMWDGWMFNVWRGQVMGAGAFMGQALAKTPIPAFSDEMRRWGVRHLVVWTDAAREYLRSSPRFVERWRQGTWSEFEYLDADVRSVATFTGTGSLTDLDPLGATVRLVDVRAGERVVIRTNYYPAWTAQLSGRPVVLSSERGQLAFDAPASGTYDIVLEYPKRRGLSLLALGVLLIGCWGISRWPVSKRNAGSATAA
jgi:hypothetical protein